MLFDRFSKFALLHSLCVRGHTRTGTEWFFGGMPIFTCDAEQERVRKLALKLIGIESLKTIPFFLIP